MAREHIAGDRDNKMTELPRRTYLAGAGALLVGLSGCLGNDDGNEDEENGGDGNSGGNGSDGNDGGQSDPEIAFTEDETNGVGVQVTNMGGYDAVWVEHENLDGGFQISETRDVPVLYLSDTGYVQFGDVCFKESHTADCKGAALDGERAAQLSRDGRIEVYGLHDGEKTLVTSR